MLPSKRFLTWNRRSTITFAARSLVEIGTPEALNGLVDLCKEARASDAEKAFEIARKLAKCKSPVVKDFLIDLVRGPAKAQWKDGRRDVNVPWPRADAAQTLGEIGGPGVRLALEYLLSDEEASLAELASAASALQKLGDPKAVPALEGALARLRATGHLGSHAANSVEAALKKLWTATETPAP